MKRIRNLPLLTLAIFFGASSVALAAPIPIANASFEASGLDPGGWANALPPADVGDTGTGWIGRAGPNDGGTFVEYIDGFSAEGTHHLGMQNNYYVFQNTGAPWQANTTYTLTVGIGNRNAGFSPEGALAIIGLTNLADAPSADNRLANITANELLDSDPWLAVASASVPPPADESTFEDATVSFTTGATPPVGNVVIFLGDDISTGRAHFDHVRLDATSAAGGGLPTPIGYWSFDDQLPITADLAAGNGGTVNGDATFVAGHSGQVGDYAIDFDGVDDSVTTEISLLNNLANLTMSFWIRFPEQQLGNRIGLVGQNDAVEYGMINPTTMQWWSPAGAFDVPFGPTVEDWTHVAVVLDDEGFTLYANGVILGSAAGGGPVSSGDPLRIGGDGVFDASGNFFLGQIDDVAIWDIALSESDILALATFQEKPIGNDGGGEVNPLDPDGDGIFTPLELKHGLDPNVADADSDNDGDGIIASVEIFELGTLANNPDTDGDGLSDGVETNTGTYVDASNTGTDPKVADTDKDGLADGAEVPPGGTSPVNADTDGDGFSDGKERTAGTNPLDANSKPDFPVVIGYWPFDDQGASETEDLGPSSIVSTVNGDPEWVAGHTGMPGDFAIKFDGEDDSVTTEVSLLNNLPNLTMSLWVRMEEEQLGNRIGLVGQNDAVEYGMINPTTMQWWSPAGAFDAEFGPIVEEWTHVAVVLDDVGYTVYANGEVLGGAEGGGPVSSGDTLNIGGDGIFDNAGNFFLGEIDDVAIWDTALTEAQIQDLAAGAVCPLGACGGAAFQVNHVSRDNATGMVDLRWSSFAGTYFDIETSPDLTSGSWQVIANDLPAAGGDTVETSAMVPGSTEAAMEYLRVVQVPAPPLLETGFEAGLGDWTSSGAGTLWTAGSPSNGPGAAKTGTGVVAVGLAGNYADATQAILQTPVIDPTAVSGSVKLEFSYYLEATNEEGGQLSILEADGTLIQTLEPLFIGGEDGNTADWTDISIRLPKLDPVRPFIIQFTFLSLEDGEANNGAGWFIDDVRIGK